MTNKLKHIEKDVNNKKMKYVKNINREVRNNTKRIKTQRIQIH